MRAVIRPAVAGAVALLVLAGCERPPVEAEQQGYRGLGMEQLTNPRLAAEKAAANQVPEAYPPAEPGGPMAVDVYQNVQVLTDLTEEEFLRVMSAITDWVAPEEGCTYCHVDEGLEIDRPYTKIVSRRMLEMTRHINANWHDHVGATGVTCHTCHRGQPVPEFVWYEDPGPNTAFGMGNRAGQNAPAQQVALSSLPYDALSRYLDEHGDARVVPTETFPTGSDLGIKDAENTYALMMHISQSLGVNCTYCHNTRTFFAWDQSTPQRTTAWHGIRLTRDLNAHYLEPLLGEYPPERLGPLGDAPKVNCETCHQGLPLPLYGASMIAAYPELAAARPMPPPAARPEETTEEAPEGDTQ